MAFEWITGGAPQFWKNYVSLFDKEEKQRRYVVFDMETTGTDYKEDVILSIGAIGIAGDSIAIGNFLEVYLKQDRYAPHSVAHNDVVKDTAPERVVEAEALIQFLNFAKNATLVSHNINLDIEMLNQALRRLDLGRLRNDIMDTNVLFQKWRDLPEDYQASLDEVCDALKIQKSDRQTVSVNAYTTALAFLKLKKKLSL